MEAFEKDLVASLQVLQEGGVILYPTDTIWGLGCDATNAAAVDRIFHITKRVEANGLIVLLADERSIFQYTAAPDLSVFDFLAAQEQPTTVVYNHALGLPDNLLAADGSVAIRLVQDPFCRHLIKRFRKPLVAASANSSGRTHPAHFGAIDENIIGAADYVVTWRQTDRTAAQPSPIVRWNGDGTVTGLRR